jgi:hypothetical protein
MFNSITPVSHPPAVPSIKPSTHKNQATLDLFNSFLNEKINLFDTERLGNLSFYKGVDVES